MGERAMSARGEEERDEELEALERELSAVMYSRGNKNDRRIPMYGQARNNVRRGYVYVRAQTRERTRTERREDGGILGDGGRREGQARKREYNSDYDEHTRTRAAQ